MKTLEEKIELIPKIISSLEAKIKDLTISDSELSKIQNELDSIDTQIDSRAIKLSSGSIVNMLELQSLIHYARGDVNKAEKFIHDASEANDGTAVLKSHLANDLHKRTSGKENGNKTAVDNPYIPHYFTVSTIRLVITCLATLSVYLIYWGYKNWKAIQATNPINKDGKIVKVNPKLTALFFGLTSYELFNRVRRSSKELQLERSVKAGLYAWGVILLNVVCLGFLPVITVQKHMNAIKLAHFNDEEIKRGTSVGEIIFIIIGGFLGWGLAVSQFQQANVAETSQISSEAQQKNLEKDSLNAEYETCSSALTAKQNSVDKNSQSAIDTYNAEYDSCEGVRTKLNAVINEYNTLIGQ